MTATLADRRADLARIHILVKDLAMPRDEYEGVLFTLARVRSSADLDAAGRQQVIAHLSALLRKNQGKPRANEWAFIDRAAPERQPMLRKILMQLRSAQRGKSYGDGVALQMFGVQRLEFCDCAQLHDVVAALAKDAARAKARRAAKAGAGA